MDEQLAGWLSDLHNRDPAIRNRAITAIRETGDSILSDILVVLATSDINQTRADALMALQALTNPSTIPVLE